MQYENAKTAPPKKLPFRVKIIANLLAQFGDFS